METYDSTKDTLIHIKRVNELLIGASMHLLNRAIEHDESKLQEPEKTGFDNAVELKKLIYDSDEYKQSLADLGATLNHHYTNNSHHPEHYTNGIGGMNLFDLIEMFFDWKAATERTESGNIYTSIEKNKHRFDMSDQLVNIFKNTCTLLNY